MGSTHTKSKPNPSNGTVEAPISMVANKPFRMWGIDYHPGDPVDVSHLSDYKVGQLMKQRYLRPIAPDTPNTDPG